MNFPKEFLWGAATAAYQVEGGSDERGESVWDMFCRRPGAVAFGQNGLDACDHYHEYQKDIRLMQEIGIGAYRFSVSWPRIFPDGLGKINQKGIDFYNQLIDSLLEAGIEPYLTMFHWDYPLALYRRGGWLNPDSPKWFAEYAQTLVALFSDRVSNWMTLNETLCFIGLGHADGTHAPGLRLSEEEVLICAHHSLLAHGLAVQAIRQTAKKEPAVGYAAVGETRIPSSNQKRDIDAARTEMFRVYDPQYWGNAMWTDPLFLGYPKEIRQAFDTYHIKITDEDCRIIREPIDFLGLNIYTAPYIGHGGQKRSAPGFSQTAMNWEITPEALYWGPKFFYDRYHTPIMITENGMANVDIISEDGKVHDPQRIEFLRQYLAQLERCIKDGTDVRAYFLWSLLDNFEWAEGLQKRFGLVYVDYQTQNRIMKDSAYWYKKMIKGEI